MAGGLNERGPVGGSGRLPPPSGFWNRDSPDRALFGSAARYPFMALEQPRDEHDYGVQPAPPPPPRPVLPTSMSLRSMVNSGPWEEEDDAYTDTDELPDRSIDRERLPPDSDHEVNRIPPPSSSGGHGHAGDPVALGYLTLEEAKVLFNLFLKNFNIAMPLLDPATHTHGMSITSCPRAD